MTSISVDWKHADTHWGFERREVLQNKGKALVFNLMKPRRAAAMIDMVEEIERRGWTLPDPSDKKYPYGPAYWIVKNSSEGHYGGNPTGYAIAADALADIDREVPYGANMHGLAIRAACLAVAEREIKKMYGVHGANYDSLLLAAIRRDIEVSAHCLFAGRNEIGELENYRHGIVTYERST